MKGAGTCFWKKREPLDDARMMALARSLSTISMPA